MTDMAITVCVPLPGEGLVARRGGLVVVTDGQADGPDPLLGALEEVTGDGAALILAAARAMLTHPGQVSGACAGVTASGEVAVLVHGNATVTVVADDGPEEQIDARGSMLPVSRTFSGSTVRVWLRSGGPVTSDDRLRLDGGVVYSGGVALTVASVAELAGSAAPRPAVTDIMTPGTGSAGEAETGPGQAAQTPMAGPMTWDSPVAPSGGDLGRTDLLPLPHPPGQEPAGVSGSADFWFTAGREAVSEQAERPSPTFVVPATGPAAPGREPPLHNPQGADFEYELFLGPDDARPARTRPRPRPGGPGTGA